MKLTDLMKPGVLRQLATATVATTATVAPLTPSSVATVATVAVANPLKRATNDAGEPEAHDAAEWIEERAAILEHDAGLTRADAESRAAELFEAWRTVDRLYLAHHWTCPACIGAGQGRGLRCGVGAALWTNYENTPRNPND